MRICPMNIYGISTSMLKLYGSQSFQIEEQHTLLHDEELFANVFLQFIRQEVKSLCSTHTLTGRTPKEIEDYEKKIGLELQQFYKTKIPNFEDGLIVFLAPNKKFKHHNSKTHDSLDDVQIQLQIDSKDFFTKVWPSLIIDFIDKNEKINEKNKKEIVKLILHIFIIFYMHKCNKKLHSERTKELKKLCENIFKINKKMFDDLFKKIMEKEIVFSDLASINPKYAFRKIQDIQGFSVDRINTIYDLMKQDLKKLKPQIPVAVKKNHGTTYLIAGSATVATGAVVTDGFGLTNNDTTEISDISIETDPKVPSMVKV